MIQFELNGLTFEYDETKGKSNWTKHNLLFEEAAYVFFDPLKKEEYNRTRNREDRWKIMGKTSGLFAVVIYSERTTDHAKKIIRLISARKATKRERK